MENQMNKITFGKKDKIFTCSPPLIKYSLYLKRNIKSSRKSLLILFFFSSLFGKLSEACMWGQRSTMWRDVSAAGLRFAGCCGSSVWLTPSNATVSVPVGPTFRCPCLPCHAPFLPTFTLSPGPVPHPLPYLMLPQPLWSTPCLVLCSQYCGPDWPQPT